jgi:hypothetical protein
MVLDPPVDFVVHKFLSRRVDPAARCLFDALTTWDEMAFPRAALFIVGFLSALHLSRSSTGDRFNPVMPHGICSYQLLCDHGTLCVVIYWYDGFCVFVPSDVDFSRVRAVNLGGWLVVERWIKPSLFDGIPNGDMLVGSPVH